MATSDWTRPLREELTSEALVEITQAAARGESLEVILETAVQGLLRAGRADRAGVWFRHPEGGQSQTSPGAVVEAAGSWVPPEWKRFDWSQPSLATLEQSGEPVMISCAEGLPAVRSGAFSQMGGALLIPLRVQARFLGLAMCAWTRLRPLPDTTPMLQLASVLSLVVAQRQDQERCEDRSRERAELARISQAISAGMATRQALAEIARAARRFTEAEFVAAGWATRPPWDAEVCDPDTANARNFLAAEETARLWVTTVAERRVVTASATGLTAHPLQNSQQVLGVLLARFGPAERPSEGTALLNPYLALAATALDRHAELRPDSGAHHPAASAPSAHPASHLDSASVLNALLDSVNCGVLVFDSFGDLRVASAPLAQMLGTEPERLRELGTFQSVVAYLAPRFKGSEALAPRWLQRLAGGEATWDELEFASPVRFARPILDPAGRRLGWIEVYRDVTEQRLTESKLLHTGRMVALGELVSSVAHEINNPLTSIFGYAQLRLRPREGAHVAIEAQHILQEAERASRIARNLLMFARGAKVERAPAGLNEIVQRAVALRTYALGLAGIRAHLNLDPNLPPIRADAPQLQQAVLNLLLNAEQAIQQNSGNSGRIWLRTRRVSNERIALDVTDDGPGIAADVLPRIFDPFFTTKPPGSGTGIGLSIVYGIVQQHGGEVSVSSDPGSGAMFTLQLPALPLPALAHPLPPSPQAPLLPALPRPPVTETHLQRILVVEDEPTVARLIADVLAEEGYSVDTILDSRQALDLAGRNAYDLLICDLRMPYLDGRGLYSELLRVASPLAHRLVFVTGDTLSPRTLEFLESSAVPYLAKPFLVEELKDLVRGTLTRAGMGASTEAQQGVI